MVRTFLCHPFTEIRSFSDQYEPTAICCNHDNFVFVASSKGTINSYNISQGTCPLEKQFTSAGVSLKMVYSNKHGFLVSLETKLHDYKVGVTPRDVSCQVKVYTNLHLSVPHKVYIPVANGYSTKPDMHAPACGQFNIVEIALDHSVTDVAVCPSKGNIAAACAKKVYLLSYFEMSHGVNRDIDFYPLMEMESNFSLINVSVYVNWVAMASKNEVRVVQVYLNTVQGDDVGEDVTQLLESCSVEEMNDRCEDFVIWNFDQNDAIALRRDSRRALTPDTPDKNINLSLITMEPPYVDETNKVKEVLGYYEDLVGHPLKLSTPHDNRQPSAVTCLYRRFSDTELSVAGNVDHLHSLQFLPLYTNATCEESAIDSSLHTSLYQSDSPTLLSLAFFLSTGKHGYLYDLTKTPAKVCTYSYTNDCLSADHTLFNLNAVTGGGLEIYTSRLYALACEHYQSWTNPTDAHKFTPEVPAIERNRSQSDLFFEQNFFENYVRVENCADDTNQVQQQYLLHSQYLKYCCPWRDVEVCMMGMYPLPCVLLTTSTRSHQVLTVKSYSGSKGRGGGEERVSPWNVYVLENAPLEMIYDRVNTLVAGSERSNPSIYYQMVCELHMLVRSHMVAGVDRENLLPMLQSTATKIADFFASDSSTSYYEKIIEFYDLAGLSFNENLKRLQTTRSQERKFDLGMICYLDHFLFGKDELNIDEEDLDFILNVYLQLKPSVLSKIYLHSQLHVSPDLAINYMMVFKEKDEESFTCLDELCVALLYMALGDPTLAETTLKDIPESQLVTTCVSNYSYLFAGDQLTPMGQLVKKRFSSLLRKVLIELFSTGVIGIEQILNIYMKKREKKASLKCCSVLEALLNGISHKNHFASLCIELCRLYVDRLTKAKCEKLVENNHQHIPKGDGMFSPRFKWLDSMPPFTGDVPCAQDCILTTVSHNSPSLARRALKHTNKQQDNTNSNINSNITSSINSKQCPCCCCSQTLAKFQSLLCSKFIRKEVALKLLDLLKDISFVGKDSLLVLCWPKAGLANECVDYMLANYTKSTIQYAKDLFDWKVQWQTLLQKTVTLLKDDNAQWNKLAFQDLLKGVLLRLTRAYSPDDFVGFLPDDGNVDFFLPYVVECWQYKQAGDIKRNIVQLHQPV